LSEGLRLKKDRVVPLFLAVILFAFLFPPIKNIPIAEAQVDEQHVFGNDALPDWKNITVTVAGDGKSFTLDNADNLTWTFWYGANKYNSINQNGVQIVKDELWMLQFYDGSWKDIGSSGNVFYEQVTSYNVKVTQTYTSANGNYNVTWSFYGGFRPKITFSANITVAGDYRIDWRTYVYKDYAVNMTNYVRFWNGDEEAVVFDYSDVYETFGNITSVEGVAGWVKGKKFDLVLNVGFLEVGLFRLDPTFGYAEIGTSNEDSKGTTKGSWFTGAAGEADSMSVYVYIDNTIKGTVETFKIRGAIYKKADSSLVGQTDLWSINLAQTTWGPAWITLAFSSPPIIESTDYYLLVSCSAPTADCYVYLYYSTVVGKGGSVSQDWTTAGFPSTITLNVNDKKYSIYCTYTFPSIGEFQAPSTVYANKYFFLNATINDDDGVADFVNATIEINGSIILKWVNTTLETYHFSEYSDSNGYCTLDVANSIKTNLNTTAHKLSWKIKLTWNYTEGSVSVISTNTKVFDSAGASGSGATTSLFTFEDDLIIHTDAAVDDSRVNPSQSITFTASIYYQGTSTAPEDVTGITGRVELAGVLKGSDADVTGGLSIAINAESTVANYSYNIYAYTNENSVTNQTVYVVVERGVITISANTTSPAPNAYVSFTLTAIYDFDDQPITSWTVNTLRNSTHFAAGNFTDGGYDDVIYVYTAENMTENTYGLTSFTSNTLTVYWSTYVALTIKTVDLDSEILTSAIVDFNGTEITVDANGLATKSGIVKYNNITVKVKWQGCWVNGSWTVNMTETKTIEASCNVWSFTINAKDDSGTMLSLSSTKFVWTFPNNTQVNTTKTDGTSTFLIMNGTHYYQIEYQGQWVSLNVTLPVDNKNVTVVNKNCWVYSLTVYVTDTNNQEKSGAELKLTRTDNYDYASAGLTPKTAEYYNSTHARYVWSQLANQTSSYTTEATSGGQSASTTTSLTANTEALITLPGGTESPNIPGGYTQPPVEQPPAYIPPVELPKVPGAEFEYGIFVLVGVVAVAVSVALAKPKTQSLTRKWERRSHVDSGDLSRKWRKKAKRK